MTMSQPCLLSFVVFCWWVIDDDKLVRLFIVFLFCCIVIKNDDKLTKLVAIFFSFDGLQTTTIQQSSSSFVFIFKWAIDDHELAIYCHLCFFEMGCKWWQVGLSLLSFVFILCCKRQQQTKILVDHHHL
jgi:hypothetical protein